MIIAETMAELEAVDHPDLGCHIAGFARPKQGAYRTPVGVYQHRENHLPQALPMIRAVAIAADPLRCPDRQVDCVRAFAREGTYPKLG
jgi:hypothetical protein